MNLNGISMPRGKDLSRKRKIIARKCESIETFLSKHPKKRVKRKTLNQKNRLSMMKSHQAQVKTRSSNAKQESGIKFMFYLNKATLRSSCFSY